jgi:hypothetical protein
MGRGCGRTGKGCRWGGVGLAAFVTSHGTSTALSRLHLPHLVCPIPTCTPPGTPTRPRTYHAPSHCPTGTPCLPPRQ